MSEDKPLIGYMILDSWTHISDDDDRPDPDCSWDGMITGPRNPEGANKYWENPIPMIEKSAYDKAQSRIEELEAENKELHKMVDQGIDNFGDERRKNRELVEVIKTVHKDLDEGFVSPAAVRLIAELEQVLKKHGLWEGY